MPAIGTALSVGLIGLKAHVVEVQAFVSPGLPYFSLIGLPDASLAEGRERIKSACQSAGFSWPETRVVVNLSPASLPKRGAAFDLAIAASIMSASSFLPIGVFERTVLLGELNLDGTVLPVNGVLPVMLRMRERGLRRIIVPWANLEEARLIGDVEAVGVRHVRDLLALAGKRGYRMSDARTMSVADRPQDQPLVMPRLGDMSEVIGQEEAKWALQVAAAGGHHLLMVGPPGSGKTMLASRMPGIMCPLDEAGQLEVASIRSLCGTLPQYGITDMPPFEAPHHTSSTAALVGGGAGLAAPGAITRAHLGVLFMDEAPEFSARALQTLREPLESGFVALSRSKGTTHYPARFQLVMAANPCPCGYADGTGARCVCREKDRIKYMARMSGPILDRIDIQVTVRAVPRIMAGGVRDGQTSLQIRRRVVQARAAARERFAKMGWSCNAQISGPWLREHMSQAAIACVNQALENGRLTLRGADRAMRLAWTLADLSGRTSPDVELMEQGIALRTRW